MENGTEKNGMLEEEHFTRNEDRKNTKTTLAIIDAMIERSYVCIIVSLA